MTFWQTAGVGVSRAGGEERRGFGLSRSLRPPPPSLPSLLVMFSLSDSALPVRPAATTPQGRQEKGAVISLWCCSRGDATSVASRRVRAQAGRPVPAPLNTPAAVPPSTRLRPRPVPPAPRCARWSPLSIEKQAPCPTELKAHRAARHHE